MEDLKEGMILKGTVRNVVDFGAFVDIGVKQDGLVHLSQMSYKYVKSPLEVAAVGDVVDVRILKVDPEKGRIGLSMLLEGEKQKPQPKPERPPQGERRPPRRDDDRRPRDRDDRRPRDRDDRRPRDHDQRDRKFDKPKPPERIGNTPRIVVDTRKKK